LTSDWNVRPTCAFAMISSHLRKMSDGLGTFVTKLALAEHPDDERPRCSVCLEVNQHLGDTAASLVSEEVPDPPGPRLVVANRQDLQLRERTWGG
jgi:hypothetical protein